MGQCGNTSKRRGRQPVVIAVECLKAQAFIQPARHHVGRTHLQFGPLRSLRLPPVHQAMHQRPAQSLAAQRRRDGDVIQAHAAALHDGQAKPGHLAAHSTAHLQRSKCGGPGNGLQHMVVRLPVLLRHGAGLGKALQPGRARPGLNGKGPALVVRWRRHVRQCGTHHQGRVGQQVAGLRQLRIRLGTCQGREAKDGRQALALVEGLDLRQQGVKAGAGLLGIGRVGALGMALRGAQQPIPAEHGALGWPGVEAALLHAHHRLGIAFHGCAVMSERLGHARLYHGRPPCPPIIWRAAALAAGTLSHYCDRRRSPDCSMTTDTSQAPRLTSLSHGGGCGCKIAPGLLAELIGKSALPKQFFPDLLVGTETADDAAVYRINDEQAIVATTDFFMPIVDDPYDFGRIAATNALSDIYAMGGQPLMALAIVGMPINVLPHDTIAKILEGGESVCRDAGIPLAGGHSIDSVEPIYGLVGIGIVNPRQMKRNADARAGDVLILGKPLGVGILSAALKKNLLDEAGYRAMVEATTLLNRPGTALGKMDGVHALTDVTGFGLLGHGLELARGAGLTARIDSRSLPVLPTVQGFAEQGVITGASGRNWASYGAQVALGAGITDAQRALLTDPQTSGGLLVSCAPDVADQVLALFAEQGFGSAAIVGRMEAGEPRVIVD